MSKLTCFALSWFCFGIALMTAIDAIIHQNEMYFIGFAIMSALGAILIISYHEKDVDEGTF